MFVNKANLKNILTVVRDIINRSFANAIRKAQSAEKQARNARLAANAAQTTADNAQATADNAKTAANAAEATAYNAQTIAYNAQTAANLSNKVLDLYLLEGQLRFKAGDSSQPPLRLRDLLLNDFVFSEHSLGGTVVASVVSAGGKQFIEGNTLSYPMRHVKSDEHTDLSDTEFVFTSRPIAPKQLYLSNNLSKTYKITVDDNGTLSATEVTT